MHRGDTSRGAAARARGAAAGRARAGFTLIELAIVIVVIALLATMGVVAAGRAIRSSRNAAERQLLVAIRQGVDAFRMQFGFLPPLVIDGDNVPPGAQPTTTNGPLTTGSPKQPVVRNEAFLSRSTPTGANEPRSSVYTVPYYLMGMLDMPDGGTPPKPIDGFEGSSFSTPLSNGTFSQRGAPISPLLDSAALRNRVWRSANPNYQWQIVVMDRWQTPIRFYRWQPRFDTGANSSTRGMLQQHFVPREVGDPNTKAELRSAEYAIVSLGADRKTDEDYSDPNNPRPKLPLPTNGVAAAPHTDPTPIDESVTKDDIVEVGR